MKFLFFGKNGEIEEGSNFQGRPPLVEIDLGVNIGGFVAETKKPMSDFVREQLEKHYKQLGRFGLYGDVIQVTCIQVDKGYVYSCDFIGRLAFPKPGLAADLVPFITGKEGNTFFVGITRKKNPGKGKPALLGGFLNVNGRHFETAAEAIIRESGEEASFQIEAIDLEKIKKEPYINMAPVRIKFGNKEISTLLQLIGTFQTSDEEILPSGDRKRVDEATAYGFEALFHDLSLTKEMIAEILAAGDDAESLVIIEIGKDPMPEFSFGHHRVIFNKALEKLGIIKKMEMREKRKGVQR